jgi:hypothetical protein
MECWHQGQFGQSTLSLSISKKTEFKKITKKMTKKKTETTENVSVDVYLMDSHVYTCWRGPIRVNAETHPELKGMTEQEMKDYVSKNASEMTSIDSDYYDNLYDQLIDADYGKDKITGEEYEITF